MNTDMRPCAITFSERFSYDVRAEATRIILGSGGVDMAHPKLREVLLCLAAMSYGGILEYYGSWDDELTLLCLSREHALAEDLANIEAKLLQTTEGTTTLKSEVKAELAQQEAELRALLDVDRRPARPPQLPPGTPVSMTTLRGLALLRQREREDNAE